MGLSALRKSRKLWLAREAYRKAKWRYYRYRSKRPTAERMMLRRKWWRLWQEATAMREKREYQIAHWDAVTISKPGMDFIAKEEGEVRHAYNDPAGHATFGIGHLIHHGAVTDADRKVWGTKSNPKSHEFVMEVFDKDLDKYEAAVRDAVSVRLKQHEFDALVSLCFNIGIAGFKGSTVVKRLNAGDKKGAADAILMWNKPSMLIPRREREKARFLNK